MRRATPAFVPCFLKMALFRGAEPMSMPKLGLESVKSIRVVSGMAHIPALLAFQPSADT